MLTVIEYAKEAGWRILLFPKLNMGYWPFPDTEMEAHFLLDHTDYLGHTIPSGNGVDLFSAYDALYLSNECKSGKVTRVWEVVSNLIPPEHRTTTDSRRALTDAFSHALIVSAVKMSSSSLTTY